MGLSLHQNAVRKNILIVFVIFLLALFFSFLFFEVFDIDGSNAQPISYFDDIFSIETAAFHKSHVGPIFNSFPVLFSWLLLFSFALLYLRGLREEPSGAFSNVLFSARRRHAGRRLLARSGLSSDFSLPSV